MSLLNEEVRSFIGREGPLESACDVVERGAVRRYAQAMMDHDPRYAQSSPDGRYGGPVAPPLFPMNMFRRPFGAPDPLAVTRDNPDYDGVAGTVAQGLPDLPLPTMVLLNGGTEVDFRRYAQHGEKMTAQSRYIDIIEKQGRSGPMLLVRIETTYRGGDDTVLMIVTKTLIRRPA